MVAADAPVLRGLLLQSRAVQHAGIGREERMASSVGHRARAAHSTDSSKPAGSRRLRRAVRSLAASALLPVLGLCNAAPAAWASSIYEGRIRNLRNQIDNFRHQLEECERKNGKKS